MQALRDAPCRRLWVVRCKVRENADAPYPLRLLRSRREQLDELASFAQSLSATRPAASDPKALFSLMP
jgi:hypothetical protein